MNESFKELHGQVNTPEYLVGQIFNLLPNHLLRDSTLKWLDPGCGTGVFSKYILDRLAISLNSDNETIIKNNLYMVEYNNYHNDKLLDLFGENINLSNSDYLLYQPDIKFDIIIGNPPYNQNHLRHIPNKLNPKKTDKKWIPIWHMFIEKSIELLNDYGYLTFIIPATWLKPDKANIYELLTKYKIHKLHSLSSYEVYKAFNKSAQIPCTYFLLQKIPTDNIIPIYDDITNTYINYNLYKPNLPIPMKNISILNKLIYYTEKYGSLYDHVLITPTPSRKITLSDSESEQFCYKNIYTCNLLNSEPVLKYKWSDKPGPFYCVGLPKLVLAHSVFGFPFLDISGICGICSRDKFVFLGNLNFLNALNNFLSLKCSYFLYSSTRYRMRFLERYIFELIPDISKLPDFDLTKISDQYIYEYFDFNKNEIDLITKTKLWK